MKRSPVASVSQPPEPRRPSSSTVPVMRVPAPASRPVGWNCTISMSRSGEAGAQRHRHAVARLVARGRVIAVHGRPAAGREQRCARAHHAAARPMRMSSMSTPASPEPSAAGMRSSARWSSSRRTSRRHTCSARRLMISMPVRSPLWTVRSKVCPANAFWWTVPSGLRSKKQPTSFSSSRMRTGACDTSSQASSWSLSQPPPSIVSMKWRSTEFAGRERHVVAALHHAGAAAFSQQALHRDGDVELRASLVWHAAPPTGQRRRRRGSGYRSRPSAWPSFRCACSSRRTDAHFAG